MKWSEIPIDARRYIMYHTIVSPLLITWYMLPTYMFMTGYSILKIGILFTLINVASIPLTYLIGKLFDRIAVRHGLILIDSLDGLENILYGLSYGPLAPLVLFLGLIIDRINRMFYPLYQVAEKLLYPKDKLEEVFAWHMRLPLLSELIGSITLGYVFGVIFYTPEYFRIGFIVIGVFSVLTISYLMKYLPRLDVEERIGEEFKFKFDTEFKAILAIEALDTLANLLAPEIVLLNYMLFVLGLSFFEFMIVMAISLIAGSVIATYISERINPKHRFKIISLNYILTTIWALIMFLNPSFIAIIIAYFILDFGDTLAFPFYRSWLFSKVPKEKASSLLSALSSYDRLIGVITPFLAGLLASLHSTLPYLASLILFTATIPILISLQKNLQER